MGNDLALTTYRPVSRLWVALRLQFLYLVRKATSCWGRWTGLARLVTVGLMLGECYPEARPLR